MFTGIVTDIGRVRSVERRGDLRLVIDTDTDLATVDLGGSIACSGVCLTVVAKGDDGDRGWFAVDVSGETVSKTAPGHWRKGAHLNLERALRLGDELGGHLVTGHVDGVGTVTAVARDGDSTRVEVLAPLAIGKFIAAKGSVTVDGVSLTVNAVADGPDGTTFALNIIPHTGDHTTLGTIREGATVNLEIDVLARYLQRLEDARAM